MLPNDFAAKLLDMEHMRFLDVKQTTTTVTLTVEMQRRSCSCSKCGAFTDKVHDYRVQKIKDSSLQGKACVWLSRKRRYRYPCCGKRFYESNYLIPKWRRITNRLALLTLQQLESKQSRKEIAQDMHVSPSTVGRWLRLSECGRPSKLPSVLSIDEFKGNTEYGKFQCILTAPKERRVLDVLPTCKESELYQYLSAFSSRNDVRFFVSDMKKEYISLAKRLLPNATIVIDRFHVVRYCTWALENVRKRMQKKLLPEQRRYFKRSRKLLLKHMADLKPESMDAVNRMLLFDRDLREAYLLKEKFYAFMASKDSVQAKERLRAFRMFAFTADIPEFKDCLTMLQNWEPYILNAFDCPYSNGFTEGCNNTIKVIKRVAYGYRNFRNFKCRILLTFHGTRSSAA